MNHLLLTFDGTLTLAFEIFETPIAQRWKEALREGIANYPLDDPRRFYGFNSREREEEIALQKINESIRTINEHTPGLIDRNLDSIYDQDYLNELHHVFEVFHGGLNEYHEVFTYAPKHVQEALARLNIDVHRCENLRDRLGPGIVCTWYGLPKTRHYEAADFIHKTNRYRFGHIYIQYAEIGKTLHDLAKDNDEIDPESFLPLDHFSADFALKFYDVPNDVADEQIEMSRAFFEKHQKTFAALGWPTLTSQMLPGKIPVAHLLTNLTREEVIDAIRIRPVISGVQVL